MFYKYASETQKEIFRTKVCKNGLSNKKRQQEWVEEYVRAIVTNDDQIIKNIIQQYHISRKTLASNFCFHATQQQKQLVAAKRAEIETKNQNEKIEVYLKIIENQDLTLLKNYETNKGLKYAYSSLQKNFSKYANEEQRSRLIKLREQNPKIEWKKIDKSQST
jgi:methylphosphotriester-DNA--protein-cysteine methyltransferase